jgi:hypothetical protein
MFGRTLQMSVKRKMRKRQTGRALRSRSADGRDVILAPIIGKDGKIHRFIAIPRWGSDLYLRTD